MSRIPEAARKKATNHAFEYHKIGVDRGRPSALRRGCDVESDAEWRCVLTGTNWHSDQRSIAGRQGVRSAHCQHHWATAIFHDISLYLLFGYTGKEPTYIRFRQVLFVRFFTTHYFYGLPSISFSEVSNCLRR